MLATAMRLNALRRMLTIRLPTLYRPCEVRLDPLSMELVLSDGVVHASARQSDSGEIKTSTERWAYALVFQINGRLNPAQGAYAVVVAELEVIQGRVGVGCLNRERDAYLTEQFADADAARRRLVLRVPASRISDIVLRNASADGASRFRVMRLAIALEDLAAVSADWSKPFETLRQKWVTIPLSDRRERSTDLIQLGDRDLVALWKQQRDAEGAMNLRGWYRQLYADTVPGKKILDIGCGFAYDSLTFAEQGARVTLVDIVEDNVRLVRRLAALLGLDVEVIYMESTATLAALPSDFDIVMAIGSLHNAPFEVMQPEVRELTRRLKVGGRWWQFAYPHTRWVRDGSRPFAEWAPCVDGPGTPWEEWYDVPKLLALLAPARFDLLFYTEWHDATFNWFDLVLREHHAR